MSFCFQPPGKWLWPDDDSKLAFSWANNVCENSKLDRFPQAVDLTNLHWQMHCVNVRRKKQNCTINTKRFSCHKKWHLIFGEENEEGAGGKDGTNEINWILRKLSKTGAFVWMSQKQFNKTLWGSWLHFNSLPAWNVFNLSNARQGHSVPSSGWQ